MHLRRKSGKTAEFLARIIPCSRGKIRKRENKNPTPPKNYGDIGRKVCWGRSKKSFLAHLDFFIEDTISLCMTAIKIVAK